MKFLFMAMLISSVCQAQYIQFRAYDYKTDSAKWKKINRMVSIDRDERLFRIYTAGEVREFYLLGVDTSFTSRNGVYWLHFMAVDGDRNSLILEYGIDPDRFHFTVLLSYNDKKEYYRLLKIKSKFSPIL